MLRHRSGVNKKDTFKLQIYITCYLKMTFFDFENYNIAYFLSTNNTHSISTVIMK